MIKIDLSRQELDTILVGLNELYDNETEWLSTCIENEDIKEVINAATNIKTAENLIRRLSF